jgi:hypothetical protein
MTPQSAFTIVAPIDPGRIGELRTLLASLNHGPGRVDPRSALLPFGAFEQLHFARLVVLEDATLQDAEVYGQPAPSPPTYLAFLADCDGSADALLVEMVQRAAPGLTRIFSHCQGFSPDGDLLGWLRARQRTASALYVNWIGRTVRQIREEAALRQALRGYVDAHAASLSGKPAQEAQRELRAFVDEEVKAGRLTLTPPAFTPVGWWLRNAAHLVAWPLVALLLAPLLLAYLPIFALQLRRREERDPEIAPRIDPAHAQRLAALEDHGVTNQFSAMGTIKPGLFRKLTLAAGLRILDYTTRHIYGRGHLARVSTIHFARWVFLPEGDRLLFASNYDGSLDSYMDDFINKVAFGLNLVFSNGIGYPRSRWLVADGAKDELKFKYFIRRHELATEVWYDAHPGLTSTDLDRNARIRQGVQARSLSDDAVHAWTSLI